MTNHNEHKNNNNHHHHHDHQNDELSFFQKIMSQGSPGLAICLVFFVGRPDVFSSNRLYIYIDIVIWKTIGFHIYIYYQLITNNYIYISIDIIYAMVKTWLPWMYMEYGHPPHHRNPQWVGIYI